jgi:hypothetical protein
MNDATSILASAEPTRQIHNLRQPTRYHGTAVLDPARVGRDASRIADEVIAGLAALVGTGVWVTLEVSLEGEDIGQCQTQVRARTLDGSDVGCCLTVNSTPVHTILRTFTSGECDKEVCHVCKSS